MMHDQYISGLDKTQRLLPIEELWDSLTAAPADVPVLPEHMKELNRRTEAEARGEMTFSSWDEVKKQILSGL